jgi:putative oxidoreductase
MNSQFTKIIKILLGVMLIVFGANSLFHFLPMEMPTGPAGDFINSLGATGYIFPVLGVLEIIIGAMLLLRKWVPFALILLAPISINILLFHMFLDIPGIGIAIAIVVCNVILIYKNWSAYKTLFS